MSGRSRPVYSTRRIGIVTVGAWFIAIVAMVFVSVVALPIPTAPKTVSVIDPLAPLQTIEHCAREDGSSVPEEGNGEGQSYPCQWDARVDGNGLYGPDVPPVILYYRSDLMRCPVPSHPLVWCYDILTEWGSVS